MRSKEVINKILEEMNGETGRLKEKGIVPSISFILIGDDFGSSIYVRNKKEMCAQLGFHSDTYELPQDISEGELLKLIKNLNDDDSVDGILVQAPLPKHMDMKTILDAIDPKKDVDAFHPQNIGRVLTGDYDFVPCTPQGILEILRYYEIDIEGKNCVVVGRSNTVGKPAALLMLQENATVTICHSRTKDLGAVTSAADILICAIGRAKFITEDMVKEGAVVVDVGMNRNEAGKVCGDVDFQNVKEKASYITPVPGGVGPMTVTMLMKNTLKSALLREKRMENK